MDHIVLQAKLAEQAERYDEMVIFVKQIILNKKNLNNEEMLLFSRAYKSYLGIKRQAYQALVAIKSTESNIDKIKKVDEFISNEVILILNIVNEVVEILDQQLLPNEKIIQNKVHYLKLKGDFLRYASECLKNEEFIVASTKAKNVYEEAMKIAEHELEVVDPIRLALALSYSVFIFEILHDGVCAQQISKNAFDAAIHKIETMDDTNYKEAALILQNLRDNALRMIVDK